MKDLVVLVADKDMEVVLKTLLQKRRDSLGIREIAYDIYKHPERDPGVYNYSGDFLGQLSTEHCYALVLFDFEGSNAEGDAQQAEEKVQQDLDRNGWQDRSAVIVIVPELEAWVFSNSPHVVQELAGGDEAVYKSVLSKYGSPKPSRPKEAMEELLRTHKRPRSSAIYASLAEKVSLKHCQDPSFNRLRAVLRQWFGKETDTENASENP